MPPIGLGRSHTMTFNAMPARGAEAVGHRVDVGVDARADILEIDDEHVEPAQHLGVSVRASRCRANRPEPRECRRAYGPFRSCFPERRTGIHAADRTAPQGGPAGRPPGGRRRAAARGRPTRGCRPARPVGPPVGLRSAVCPSRARPASAPNYSQQSATCLRSGELIGYAASGGSPACFARAESRSSLNPDSFPHLRESRADVRHLQGFQARLPRSPRLGERSRSKS